MNTRNKIFFLLSCSLKLVLKLKKKFKFKIIITFSARHQSNIAYRVCHTNFHTSQKLCNFKNYNSLPRKGFVCRF